MIQNDPVSEPIKPGRMDRALRRTAECRWCATGDGGDEEAGARQPAGRTCSPRRTGLHDGGVARRPDVARSQQGELRLPGTRSGGGTRRVVGGMRRVVGGTWRVVGGTWCIVGGTRRIVGDTRCVVGGTWRIVGGTWRVIGDMRRSWQYAT